MIRIQLLVHRYGLIIDERNLLQNDFSKTKRSMETILLKKILEDIQLKYGIQFGGKNSISVIDPTTSQREGTPRRKIESPEHHPSPLPKNVPRSIPLSNDRKTRET